MGRQPGGTLETGVLYCDDNLARMATLPSDSVDLIYLDPPFNSNATYNVLFSTPKGHQSDAQIEAFDDTWHWGEHAEAAFAELMQQSNTDVAEVSRALRSVLGENDMMAYLAMMAVWPAPESEDTELSVLMELEVGHGETEVYARVQA